MAATSSASGSAVSLVADFILTPSITKGENFLSFNVKEHPLKILQNMRTLQQSALFTDIVIEVDEQRFPAHRALLSASSSYFKAMFAGGLVERGKEVVRLHSITPETFASLLDFIYTGKIQLNSDNVQKLLAAADMFQLTDVLTVCTAFFKQEFQPYNCLGIYRLAEAHRCQDLIDAALNYVHVNFIDVSQSDEFLELPLELVKFLLCSENLRVDNEYQVFEAAARWLLHDAAQRRGSVHDLLECIRIMLISHRDLDMFVRNVKDVTFKGALSNLMNRLKLETRLEALEFTESSMQKMAQPRKWAHKGLYVIGGFKRDSGQRWSDGRTLNTVHRYNTYEERWQTITTLRDPRSGHSVAMLGELLFILGGENQGLLFDNVEVYSIVSDLWGSLPSLLTPRCQMGACDLHGYIYVLGGCAASAVSDAVERYDPVTRTWTQMDRMTIGRYAMGVVAHGDLIYVVGGRCYVDGDVDRVECFDPNRGRWQRLANLSKSRSYVGVAVLDGFLYVVGGCCDSKELNTVERYNFEKNYWERVSSLHTARAGCCVASISGKIYVVGGHTSAELSPSVTLTSMECYDPTTNEWKPCNDMPVGCSEAGVVVF